MCLKSPKYVFASQVRAIFGPREMLSSPCKERLGRQEDRLCRLFQLRHLTSAPVAIETKCRNGDSIRAYLGPEVGLEHCDLPVLSSEAGLYFLVVYSQVIIIVNPVKRRQRILKSDA